MSLLVGLTGGMGSGKSLTASMFRELGAYILDADVICRDLVKPEMPAWNEIVEKFGVGVLDKNKNVDRVGLAAIVFGDPAKMKVLEDILHPKVFLEEQRAYNRICGENPYAVAIVNAALLIESGNHNNMDKVIVVSCSEAEQIRRLLKRWNREDIDRRLASQMRMEKKLQYADYVIHNNGTVAELHWQVRNIHRQLSGLA